MLNDSKIIVNPGSEAKSKAMSVGVGIFKFSNIKLILSGFLYVLSLRRDLISIFNVVNKGYSVNFNT